MLLGDEPKTDSEVLSLSTSGVYSSSVSVMSDTFVSPPLSSVDPLHNLCEWSSAEQCSRSSASVEAVSRLPSRLQEFEHVSPVPDASASHREPCLLSSDATDELSDLDKALLEVDHVEALDRRREQTTDLQSVDVNSSLHKSNDSVVDCLGKVNAAQIDCDGLQEVASKAKRTLHGRSASESGIYKLGQCFSSLPEHVNVRRRYEQGTAYIVMRLCVYICLFQTAYIMSEG